MSPKQLLAYFDRIAEAPGAVPRLRQFILELAVRGRLKTEDTSDEPADVFLGQRSAILQENATPWPLPERWAWSSLELIGTSFGGGTPSKSNREFWAGQIPWVSPKDMKVERVIDSEDHITEQAIQDSAARLIPAGTLLMVVRGMILAHSFPTAINEVPVAINQDMKAVRPFRDELADFLLLLTKGMKRDVLRLVKRSTHGTCKLLTDELFALPVPIPPVAEQQRILAKVDELMALCDRLEAAQAERERRRDRCFISSVRHLISRPAVDAHFVAAPKYLDRLVTKPEQLRYLREAVLALAVRGDLVPQDINDEPLNETWRNIRSDPRYTKSPARRAAKPNSVHADVTGLPVGWARHRLADLVDPQASISYGVLVPGDNVSDGVPFVRVQDLSISSPAFRPRKTIARDVEKPYARTRLKGGEILLCVVGSIGKLGIAPPSWAGANIARAIARISPLPIISRDYLLIVLRGPDIQRYFASATRTLAQPTLNVGLVEETPLDIPPLPEQLRIVARVNEMMSVCDRLEAQLATAETESSRLLKAVLHKALEQVGASIREPAAH